jgi:hypothetical protein
MKTLKTILIYVLTLFIFPAIIQAQPHQITASVSDANPVANQSITVSLSVADAIDFYYSSFEIGFNPDLFQFMGVDNAGLSSAGIKLAEEIEPGLYGVAVSRTTALGAPGNGLFIELNFRILKTAIAGATSFTFSELEVKDSGGGELSITPPATPLAVTIAESIGDVVLTIPASVLVTEGNTYTATSKVFATGIIDNNRLTTWIGVNSSNTDPATWNETSWLPAGFTTVDGENYLLFEEEIAFQRPVGVYYVAVRSQLDAGAYTYGGLNGLWDNDSSVLEIEQAEPFRYVLSAWDFDDQTGLPSSSIPVNDDATVDVIGATDGGYAAGAAGQARSSSNWAGGEDGSKYWQTMISTENLSSLLLSSKQLGSGTGPRDWQIEVSTNGADWSAVAGSAITVANNWTSGVLTDLELPVSVNNQPEVYIRWVMTSSVNVSGGAVSAAGTSRLDDVIITGINPAAARVMVYPGDANNDGLVNADDVLALAAYWQSRGPEPIYNSLTFAPREAEEWIPAAATYADTDGNGVVNQKDLLPIGLNFGSTVAKRINQPVVDQVIISAMQQGDEIEILIRADQTLELRGVAIELTVEGVAADEWSVIGLSPSEWGNLSTSLLEFDVKRENKYEAAMSYRGRRYLSETRDLAILTLRAERNWTVDGIISLNRVTLSNNETVSKPVMQASLIVQTGVSIEEPGTELPIQTRLLPNYPNPFNPATIITFELATTGHTQLEVFDMIGRRVAILLNTPTTAGKHTIRFDASGLSSGVYVYRLTATGESFVRKMTLLK